MRLTTTAIAVAMLIYSWPHPQTPDSQGPVMRGPESQHLDDMEREALDAAIVARTEREVRPLAAPPFENTSIFMRPIEVPRQPQPQFFGAALPLMAGWSAGDELPAQL